MGCWWCRTSESLQDLHRWYREKLIPQGPRIRKAFHLASPSFLVYYVMPSDAWTAGLVSKELLVVMVLAAFLGVELLRLGLRLEVFGFRDYEARQVSAFTWAALGLTLALLLFPMVYVVPALLLVAWVDPLCRAARHRALYPWLPLAVAVALVAVVLGLESYTGLLALEPVGLAAIGILSGATAVAAEAPRLRLIDDDFRMLLAPLVVMTLVGVLLQHL